MGYKIKRIVSVLCLAAALCAAALLPVPGYCENLRFVFLADSPVGTPPQNPQPIDLINTAVLNPIINQILTLSPRPSFVVHGGDQASYGAINGANGTTYNFETFKTVMAPLTSAGIKLYTVLGNRELYSQPGLPIYRLANQQQFQQAFTENNPANGPSGYEHLAYSFESPGGDAFFAMLDPYYLTADGGLPPDVTGSFDNTQLTWLAAQLARTKATHKFFFTHAPYYYVVDPASEMGTPPGITYTNLWSILDNNLFDAYFCAHVHLFSRKAIDSSIPPNPQPTPPLPQLTWKNNVVQVINGGAGAPIVTGPITYVNPTQWHVLNAPNTYYFSVVDISGSQVTVTTYSYNSTTTAWDVCDSFTINKNSPAPRNLLLLN
jgi:hypothetical protein